MAETDHKEATPREAASLRKEASLCNKASHHKEASMRKEASLRLVCAKKLELSCQDPLTSTRVSTNFHQTLIRFLSQFYRTSTMPLTVEAAITKIQKIRGEVELRGRVTPTERARAEDAFARLASSKRPKDIRDQDYLRVLQQIEEKCDDPQTVVAVAVGLGKSAIVGLRQQERSRLARAIYENKSTLMHPIFQRLAEEYCSKGEDSIYLLGPG